jgi:rod shape-determining protein MreC
MRSRPPPHLTLFPHGLSAGAKLLLYLLTSILLITADARFHVLAFLRTTGNTLLYPIQVTAQTPWLVIRQMDTFFTRQQLLLAENKQLHQQAINFQIDAWQLQHVLQENQQLRALLALRNQQSLVSHAAEILSIPRDPYQRQITIDIGSHAGVRAGAIAVDDSGLVGQVTHVYPFTSQIALISDKDETTPVQIQRTGEHAILYGTGDGIELRYLPNHADIHLGDRLITSGLDGLYPAGLPVATITDSQSNSQSFAHINCHQLANIDRHNHILVLIPNVPHSGAPH